VNSWVFFRDQDDLQWHQAVQQNLRNSAAIAAGPVEPPYVPAEGPGQVASDASAVEEEADTPESKTEPITENVPRNVVVVTQEAPPDLVAGRAVVHPGVIATEAVIGGGPGR
jgi:hypothetical protein